MCLLVSQKTIGLNTFNTNSPTYTPICTFTLTGIMTPCSIVNIISKSADPYKLKISEINSNDNETILSELDAKGNNIIENLEMENVPLSRFVDPLNPKDGVRAFRLSVLSLNSSKVEIYEVNICSLCMK